MLARTKILAIATGIICSVDLVASAGLNISYVPPPGRGRVQRTEGSGSRGCDHFIIASYTLLAPKDHVGTTTESHPTFIWQVAATSPAPMRFTLVQEGTAKKPLMDVRVKVNKAGIVRLALPPSAPALELGRLYRWTVSEICNERRLSENSYASAFIKRVPVPEQLRSGQQKTELYGRAGIWYDAITRSYADYLARRGQSEGTFINLLNYLGLKTTTQAIKPVTVQAQTSSK